VYKNTPRRDGHDVIVIGASAGGVEALQTLTLGLKAGLAAAVLVVMHLGPKSQLVHVLGRAPLPIGWARSGEPVRHGRIYVAPPDRHLLIHEEHLMLRRGPHENRSRPSIDPLFRSAACSRGSRVIGVVLSGRLSDGSAGLRAVKRCGGIAVVQDPQNAQVPDMPRNALRYAEVDHCVSIDDMPALLMQLVQEPAGQTPDVPRDICLEAAIAAQELVTMNEMDELGTRSLFSCPECGGPLWEITDEDMLRYRCHVGHAFAADSMLAAEAEQAERTLGTLLRQYREQALLTRRLAERETSPPLAERLRARANGYEEDAEVIRRLLLRDGATAATNNDSGEC
jgi:two-component system chemotaxis response regulator CheB